MHRALKPLLARNPLDTHHSGRRPMHLRRFRFLAALFLLGLEWGASLRADTVSGTVKDPAGLTVAGARIEITGEGLPQPLILSSDEAGKFVARDLIKPGKYSIHVSKEGFQPLDTSANLQGTADLSLTLAIAQQQTTVTVNDKTLGLRQFRFLLPPAARHQAGTTYRCDNFTMPLDVGTFVFKSGTITFLAPVNGMETGAVFLGWGISR